MMPLQPCAQAAPAAGLQWHVKSCRCGMLTGLLADMHQVLWIRQTRSKLATLKMVTLTCHSTCPGRLLLPGLELSRHAILITSVCRLEGHIKALACHRSCAPALWTHVAAPVRPLTFMYCHSPGLEIAMHRGAKL